jgi:stage V sporulation protein D (sporulation-specific penicillin-binding protein)
MVTPLQLAVAYGALANEGMMMKPTIIESIRHSDGSVEKIEPQEIRQVVSTDAAKQVGEMLRSVVVNGHGKRADVPGYLVGGKTGTAQVAKVGSKGYEEGTNIGSFAGYAPINDPQFVVVVDLYDPKNVEWAESSAAPTFGEVMKFLLEYYRVKPTEDPSTSPLAKMAPISTATVQGASTTTVDNNKDKKENKKNTH